MDPTLLWVVGLVSLVVVVLGVIGANAPRGDRTVRTLPSLRMPEDTKKSGGDTRVRPIDGDTFATPSMTRTPTVSEAMGSNEAFAFKSTQQGKAGGQESSAERWVALVFGSVVLGLFGLAGYLFYWVTG